MYNIDKEMEITTNKINSALAVLESPRAFIANNSQRSSHRMPYLYTCRGMLKCYLEPGTLHNMWGK